MRRLSRAALAVASAVAAAACATRTPRRSLAPPERAAEIVGRWAAYRDAVLARPPTELFYDARAHRSVFSESFVAAVRDDPGRSLSIVLEGPLGVPLARARWTGTETVIERSGKSPLERTAQNGATLSEFGIPLSARSLSLLLFGLPDVAPPEKVELAGDSAWFSWNDGALSCEFDLDTGHARRVVSRDAKRQVEIRFLEWREGVPSHIRFDVSTGGGAELVLMSGEPNAS